MGMKKCEECGQEYSDKAEKCPHCGAPNSTVPKKKSKFKIGCLSVVGILIACCVIGSCMSSGGKDQSASSGTTTSSSSTSSKSSGQKEIVYEDANADDMVTAINENSLSASDAYKGKDLKITGAKLTKIDNDGKFIVIHGNVRYNNSFYAPFSLSLQSDDVKEQIKALKVGNHVTVWCHITKVGDDVAYKGVLKKIEAVK